MLNTWKKNADKPKRKDEMFVEAIKLTSLTRAVMFATVMNASHSFSAGMIRCEQIQLCSYKFSVDICRGIFSERCQSASDPHFLAMSVLQRTVQQF